MPGDTLLYRFSSRSIQAAFHPRSLPNYCLTAYHTTRYVCNTYMLCIPWSKCQSCSTQSLVFHLSYCDLTALSLIDIELSVSFLSFDLFDKYENVLIKSITIYRLLHDMYLNHLIIVFCSRAGLSLQTQHSPFYPFLSLPFRICIQYIIHDVVNYLSPSSASNFLPIYHTI